LDGTKRYVCDECFDKVQCGFCLGQVRKFRAKIAQQDSIWFYLCKKCQRAWAERFSVPKGVPSQEQIEQRAAQIRATWTPEERDKRRSGIRELLAVLAGDTE